MASEKSSDAAPALGGLGPIGICREALKLLRAHCRLFFGSLQCSLLLPGSVAHVALHTALACYLADPGAPTGLASLIKRPVRARASPADRQRLAVLRLAMLALALARTVWTSPVILSAGRICAGNATSCSDALLAIPRLWKRIAATSLAILVVSLGAVSLVAPSVTTLAAAVMRLDGRNALPLMLATRIVTLFGVAVLFMLVYVVPILEDDFGWEAVSTAWKLLRGRRRVALGLSFLSGFPLAVIYSCLGRALEHQAARDPWSLRLPMIASAVIVFSSLTLPWTSVCQVMMYMSCKAYHGEKIAADSIPLAEQRSPPPYQQLENDVEAGPGTKCQTQHG